MGRCFVIQPFDKGPHDKRYEDVLEPAVADAGLEAYRVDRDPTVSVVMDSIEDGIRESDACLADITTNNPNVWFELGYALASGKGVVLICSTERGERFPFDVQHRHITKYTPESTSDFDKLKADVTERLNAIVAKQAELQTIASMSPITEIQGLSPHEMAALTIVTAEMATRGLISAAEIQREMTNAGFTRVAVHLSLASLKRKKLLDSDVQSGDVYYFLTEQGEDWLRSNQHKFRMRQPIDSSDY